jgi:hypothetical protein
MGGWHLRMTWGQEVCYASLHSEPASALSLPTVWSLWGNPGMARCWEMSILPAGYIPQCKVPSASSSGSRMVDIVYQLGILSLSCSQYSQTICRHHRQMILPTGREHSHGKTQYIPGKQVLVSAWLLKTNKKRLLQLDWKWCSYFDILQQLLQTSILQMIWLLPLNSSFIIIE